MVKQLFESANVRVDRSFSLNDFSGGLNLVDNDIAMNPVFALIMDNVYYGSDGLLNVRYGTRLFRDVKYFNEQTPELLSYGSDILTNHSGESLFGGVFVGNSYTGILTDNPFKTTIGSDVIVVTHTEHGFISGQEVAFSDVTPFNGLSSSFLNSTHVITKIDANSYSIQHPTNLLVTGFGGGTIVKYLFASSKVLGEIVHQAYYNNRIVIVTNLGEVAWVLGDNSTYLIWNSNIASKQVGSPSAWTATTFASSATFNGQLIICNGINKPLIVDSEGAIYCQYLYDLVSGSNINVPIASYVTVHKKFLIMAGDPVNPTTLFISNEGTSGTWLGDAIPNNATNVDLAKFVNTKNAFINGIGTFRDNLIIQFDRITIIGTLGNINDSDVHLPLFDDTIDDCGSISHKSLQSLSTDFLSVDFSNVNSIVRNRFTDTLNPDVPSFRISQDIQSVLNNLTVLQANENIFSVWSSRNNQYMLWIPNGDEYICYVYTYNQKQGVKAWSKFHGLNFKTVCESSLGRLFMSNGSKIYVYGSDNDPIYADFVDDLIYADDKSGIPINFEYESPWGDNGSPKNWKTATDLSVYAIGDAEFNVRFYRDFLYKDQFDVKTPDISITIDNSTPSVLLYQIPIQYKLYKVSVYGSIKQQFKLRSLNLNYRIGNKH